MIHILEFDSYNVINEAGIPAYNEEAFAKNPKAEPSTEIPVSAIAKEIEDMLNGEFKFDSGAIDRISILVDIPSQGKNAPQHVLDALAIERKKIEKEQRALHGGRIEKGDIAPDDGIYGGEGRNLFLDSEYIVTGVSRVDKKEYIVALPITYYKKAMADPEKLAYYTTLIEPKQISEIFYRVK
jgi:hypothetical protein